MLKLHAFSESAGAVHPYNPDLCNIKINIFLSLRLLIWKIQHLTGIIIHKGFKNQNSDFPQETQPTSLHTQTENLHHLAS